MDKIFGENLNKKREIDHINDGLKREGVEGSIAETSDLESIPATQHVEDVDVELETADQEAVRELQEMEEQGL